MPRTKGRTSYSELEAKSLVNKLTDLLTGDAGIVSLVRNTDQILYDDTPEKKARHIETVTMANYIRENEELTKKIQAIFLEHGIEIEPSQAVTKNECISARKEAIKALLA